MWHTYCNERSNEIWNGRWRQSLYSLHKTLTAGRGGSSADCGGNTRLLYCSHFFGPLSLCWMQFTLPVCMLAAAQTLWLAETIWFFAICAKFRTTEENIFSAEGSIRFYFFFGYETTTWNVSRAVELVKFCVCVCVCVCASAVILELCYAPAYGLPQLLQTSKNAFMCAKNK